MARLPCSLALLLLAARDGNSIRHQHRRQPAQQQQQQLQCYFAVEIWYYSDWAGGHVITAGGGNQGVYLQCPPPRANVTMRSMLLTEYPDLPDVFYIYKDIGKQDYYKLWMEGGDNHDATMQRAGRFVNNQLVETGGCTFPQHVENNDGNVFTFVTAKGAAAESVNLTSCTAQAVGRRWGRSALHRPAPPPPL